MSFENPIETETEPEMERGLLTFGYSQWVSVCVRV